MDDEFLEKVMGHNDDFMDDTAVTVRAKTNTVHKLDKLFVAFVNYLINDGWQYHPMNLPRHYDCSSIEEDGLGKAANCLALATTFARLALVAGMPQGSADLERELNPFLTSRIGHASGGIVRVAGMPFVFQIFDKRLTSGNVLEVDTQSRTVPVVTGRHILFASHYIVKIKLGAEFLYYDPLMVARYVHGIGNAIFLRLKENQAVFTSEKRPDAKVFATTEIVGGALHRYVLVEPANKADVIAYRNWCKGRGRKHYLPDNVSSHLKILQHELQ